MLLPNYRDQSTVQGNEYFNTGTEQQTSIVSEKLKAEKSKTSIYTRKMLKICKELSRTTQTKAINTANEFTPKCP